jgi:hypothetical protein
MTELLFLAIFVLILFIALSYLALYHFNESEAVSARLLRVSQMLQKAELDTGIPYFTSLGNYLDIENPTKLLISKKRAVFQPIVEDEEEEEEEQEQREQSVLDTSSETEHSELPSDEGECEGAVSDVSQDSQVVPSSTVELDEYVPLFQPTRED